MNWLILRALSDLTPDQAVQMNQKILSILLPEQTATGALGQYRGADRNRWTDNGRRADCDWRTDNGRRTDDVGRTDFD